MSKPNRDANSEDSSNALIDIAQKDVDEVLQLFDTTLKGLTEAEAKRRLAKSEQELSSLGVKLNSTLSKVIRSAPESVVMNAIAALKEAITSGRIEHPGGWLKTAIESQWIPNEALEQQAKGSNTSQPTFREWYG